MRHGFRSRCARAGRVDAEIRAAHGHRYNLKFFDVVQQGDGCIGSRFDDELIVGVFDFFLDAAVRGDR